MTIELIAAVAALITAIIGVLTLIPIGVKGLSYLNEIRTDVKVAKNSIDVIEKDVDEIKKDNNKLWKKSSEHDLEIERLKARSA